MKVTRRYCCQRAKNAGIASFGNWEQSDVIKLKAPAHRIGKMGYERFNWFNRVDARVGDSTEIYGWLNWVENKMDWQKSTADSTLVTPVVGIRHNLKPTLDVCAELAYADWDAEASGEVNRLFELEAYVRWRSHERNTIMLGGEYRNNEFERTSVVASEQDA